MDRFSLRALLAVTFWGMSFVATRVVLTWLTPLGLVTARLVLGTATIAALGWLADVRHRPDASIHAASVTTERSRLILLGLILTVHLLVQNVGLLKTTATNTGWIVGFMPITIALGSRVFLKERLSIRGWLGIGVGAAGVLLVSLSSGLRFSEAKIGDLLQLSSCVTWTAYTLLSVRAIGRCGSQTVTQWTMGVAAVVTMSGCLFQPFTRGMPSGWSWVALGFLGIVCSGVAYGLWLAAVRDIGSTRTGTYLYLEPFVTMFAAAAILDERITALRVLGGLTVLLGVALVAASRRPASAA